MGSIRVVWRVSWQEEGRGWSSLHRYVERLGKISSLSPKVCTWVFCIQGDGWFLETIECSKAKNICRKGFMGLERSRHFVW